jgi:methyl-accepting chemotaxis protein
VHHVSTSGRWSKRLRGEVEVLPETLAALREGAENLRRVSEDLTGVAANLRRISEALDAAGLAETTEAMKKSGEAFRATVARFEEAEAGIRSVNDTLIDSVSWMPGAKEVLKPFRRPRP